MKKVHFTNKVLLLLACFSLGVGNAFGGGGGNSNYAKVSTTLEPTGAGTAYVGNSENPSSGTSATQNKTSEATFYLKATPNNGYTFIRWNVTYSEGQINFPDANRTQSSTWIGVAPSTNGTNNYKVNAVFQTYWAQLNSEVTPAGGGSAFVGTSANPTSGTEVTKNAVKADDDVQLYANAVPNDGYEFTRWEVVSGDGNFDNTGNASAIFNAKVSDTPTVGDATPNYRDHKIRAVFTAKSAPTFYFRAIATPIPGSGGNAQVEPSQPRVQGAAWSSTSAQTTVTFTATPYNGYAFLGWSATENGAIESTANPYVKTITSTSTNEGNPTITTLYARFAQNPTSINVTPSMSLAVGETGTVTYTLNPEGSYDNVTFTSNNMDVATVDAAGKVTAITVGTATITVQSKNMDGTNGPSGTCEVAVKDKVATPVITFEPSTSDDGETAAATIVTATEGAKIYYTINGGDPDESSTEYNESFPVNNRDVVKAIAIKDDGHFIDSDIATATYTMHKVATPTININNGAVTFSCTEEDVTYRYTTTGTAPTPNTGTVWDGNPITNIANEAIIKVIATKSGYSPSDVAEKQFVQQSGVSGGTVILNDYEDHTWTYYSGVDPEVDGGHYNDTYKASGTGTKREVRMYSPNPRNVKIVYKGNGGAVSINESETEFIYYETLEESATTGEYKYQVISNPFSKRPKINGSIKGFGGWKIVQGKQFVKGYESKTSDVDLTLGLDQEIVFTHLDDSVTYSKNCTSATVILQATWVNATVLYGQNNVSSSSFSGGTYETNLLVINSSNTSSQDLDPTYPVTIMMVEPDGSEDYRYMQFYGNIQPQSNNAGYTMKVEYMNYKAVDYVNARGRNLTIGRGMKIDNPFYIRGLGSSNLQMNQVLKIESGNYTTFTSYTSTPSSVTKHWVVLGNDYDRAKNDNEKLAFSGKFLTANNISLGVSSTGEMARVWSKSGSFMTDVAVSNADADNSYYIGVTSTHNNGHRYLEIQGGEWYANIAGGMGEDHTSTEPGFTFRMKGGKIRGSVYGAAAWAAAGGTRTYIITGGEINGWVAAGANGTSNSEGTCKGASYVYVGGDASINSKNSSTLINSGVGGNVFGAGCGFSTTSTSGQVSLGTNVVVADNAYIERGVYGGGSFGYCSTDQTSNIYITGGHIEGKSGGVNVKTQTDYWGTVTATYTYSGTINGGVYGGACQNKGGSVNIYMTGGLVESGVYGGSNSSGTINGSVAMQITGGQVGTSSTSANIHGGGYGASTVVSKNIDITLGKENQESGTGVTVCGDVYGGSALGSVNGTSANTTYHTNVTMNAGIINGSLYGGALGNNSTAANVYGPVAVNVYGGSVNKTDETGANGSGGVYGANNINGAPQRSVTVDIYGTDPVPGENQYALYAVYGGGNKADYTYGNGYPKVTVHNCENSIEYVYGGGNAAAVASTDVTIYGGNIIGNVFGGGNGTVSAANVNGNATTKIYGGTILNVYGGSNSQGTIDGTISVTADEQGETGHDLCKINITDLYGGGNEAASKAGNISIGCADHIGTVYGGANQANITGDIKLNITSGHIDNVFGGNNNGGAISGGITVTINDAKKDCGMVIGNVYGAGNIASYTGSPTVNIINATTTGSVFGGGKGSAAIVTGNPTVNIGSWATAGTVVIGKSVFGGGDAANVVGTPVVNVNTCGNTINGDLYGGGNAADVTGTDITMWGGTVKGNVFGGGNGKTEEGQPENPGANINGNTNAKIYGGTVGTWTFPDGVATCVEGTGGIFGGSNTKGNISGAANLKIEKTAYNNVDANLCDMRFFEVYGAGNEAPFNGTAVNFTLGCVDNLDYIYGGAKAADLILRNGEGQGEINLVITSGTYKGVFGGNNISGNLDAKVNVIIDETGCKPVIIDEVYGGGNLAPYLGDPKVKVISCTRIGSVFGGGKGKAGEDKGVVTGNPQVDIQMIKGRYAGTTYDRVDIPDALGTIENVFGGGNAAKVSGTPVVNIATDATVAHLGGTDTTSKVPGANITGNVYGGGKSADVTGMPQVTIGRAKQ